MEKRNTNIIFLWLLLIFGFVVVYNQAYHSVKVDYIKEIISLLMAASVTIIITSMLLRQQTENEEAKDKHAEIFKKQFETYTNFVQVLIESLEDDFNNPETLKKLENSLYQVSLFIKNHNTFDVLYETIKNSLQSDSRADIGVVIMILRDELGIHEDKKASRNKDFWHNIGKKMNTFYDLAEQVQQNKDK